MANELFLGRTVGSAAPLSLEADDLTTHGLIVGMTGSGKTALGIILIEELLRKGVPVLAVDPKGDLANLLLDFPSLSPAEFAPWLPPGGGTTAEAEAQRWTKGLSGWGLSAADVAALAASREATVYTPGSSAGVSLDLLGSLAPPPGGSAEEEGRDLTAAFLSGLLGLMGRDADPVSSREFILLARCVDEIWGRGETATLEALLATAAAPPFATVGALPLETFFPKKDRDALVLALNGLIASPATAAFRGGAALDVGRLLGKTADGRPRLSVFSIAHLGDSERLFVVATLLARVRAWMRGQPGSTALRALVYIDEIFGFFPPSAEPPTKKPLLSLLKQARAFGLGTVLATQNPVDLDYKGLANCGCWWVGTLQTERDRARLADGLTSASGLTNVEELLSQTKKRVFLLHDVHRKAPELFETRWAMSYLRGPMTREELARIPKPAQAAAAAPASATGAAVAAGAAGTAAAVAAPPPPPAGPSGPPLLPSGWSAKWLDRRGAERATPYLYVRAAVRYRSGKAISDEIPVLRLFPLDAASPREVLEGEALDAGDRPLADAPPARALRYADLPSWAGASGVKEVEKAIRDRLPDLLTATLLQDPVTGSLSNPGEDPEAFAARVAGKAKPPAALVERLEKKRRDLEQAEAAEKGRQMETLATGFGAAIDVLGGLFGKRKSLKVGRVGSVLSKRRMEATAESKVEALRQEIAELEAKTGAPDPDRFTSVEVVPARTNVDVLGAGVAWVS